MTTEPLNTLEQANKVLEGKLEKMRVALKFYAERKHYSIFNAGNTYNRGNETSLKDEGGVAREILEECK